MNLYGQPLEPADLSSLLSSWIDADMAKRALLRRVDRTEGAEIIGRKPHQQDCAGIVFPIIKPWMSDHSVAEILRRDHPEIVYEQGKKKAAQKYLCAPGGGNHFYFVPGTPLDALADTELPIIITEGAKKVLALERLARHEQSDTADKPRFLPLGLMGVWNWRGKIGIEQASDGARVPVKGLVPDFERVTWGGRRVVILYDSNAAFKREIQIAELKLGAELVKLGADVYIGRVPNRADEVNGIDDFIAAFGPAEALQIIEKAKPLPTPKADDKKHSTIIDLIESAEYFRTVDRKLWATLPREGFSETVQINSTSFKSWLTSGFYRQHGEAFPSSKLADTINLCKAKAEHDGIVHKVAYRLASYDGKIYIDLGDEERNAVEITPEHWRVVRNPPVRFRRTGTMDSLPWPVEGGDLHELRKFLNAQADDDWCAMVAWLVGAFNPKGPYSALLIQGEKGSAKTTQTSILRSLIDPCIGDESDPDAGYKRGSPKDEDALVLTAQNNWVLSLDNLSFGVSGWLSDALCRVATGGMLGKRTLYTDGEEYVVSVCRPMILNGIDDIANNADLADRALIVDLKPITSYKPVAEFREEWIEARPRIFGAILTAVVASLRYHREVKVDNLPRMADFALWVCGAASQGLLPFTPKQFIDTYRRHESAAISVLFEASPIGKAMVDFISTVIRWSGTATELLAALNRRDPAAALQKAWPKVANHLSRKIRRDAGLLRKHGIKISEAREGNARHRRIDLEWVGEGEEETETEEVEA